MEKKRTNKKTTVEVQTKDQTEKAIQSTRSPGTLKKLKAEAVKHGLTEVFNERINQLGLSIKKIEDQGAAGGKKAAALGGPDAEKKVSEITQEALAEANEIKTEATEALKKQAEAGEATELENKKTLSETFTTPKLHEKNKAVLNELLDEADKTEQPAQAGSPTTSSNNSGTLEFDANKPIVIELDPNISSGGSSENKKSNTANTEQEEEPNDGTRTVVLENENPDSGAETGPKDLDEARAEYFAAHKAFMDKRGSGFFNTIKNKFKNTIKFEDVEEKDIRERLEAKQLVYNEALVAEGNKILGKKRDELVEAGKTPDQIEAALATFKAETLFNKLIIEEKQKLIDEKKEQLPSELRAKLGRVMTWYSGLNKVQKFGLSVAVGTTIAAALAVGSTLLATGSAGAAVGAAGVAAAKTLTGKALLTKAGAMVAGQTIGAGVGGLAVMGKDKIFGFDRKIAAAGELYEQQQRELTNRPFTEESLNELQARHDERLRKEAKLKAWKVRSDFIVRIGTTFGVGMFASHQIGDALEKYLPHDATTGAEHVPKKPDVSPEPTPAASPYEFKDVKTVEYSSRGAIDTWVNVKAHIREAYQGVEDSKIPPAYKHILDTRADDLAKEFGGWRPDDVNESSNMLKGSTISFDAKTGDIVSHSLRNINGVAEDHTLASMGADGKVAYSAETNERFFDYQGKAVPSGDASSSGMDKPNFSDAGPGMDKPDFSDTQNTGIGSVKPELGKFGPGTTTVIENTTANDFSYKPGEDNMLPPTDNPGPAVEPEQYQSARDLRRAARESFRQPPYDATQNIDNAFRQTAFNSGGTIEVRPIMDPSNPAGAPGGFQEIPRYGGNLSEQQVARILNNPVRFVGNDFLNRALESRDPALPLYRVIHELQKNGYAFSPNESVSQYLARVKMENQAYFAGMNVDTRNWFVRNGFFG